MSAWLNVRPGRPLIIAHRGASCDRPENTLSAFRLACEQGADGVEFDVQLSADGVPVIIHDARVDRTTNGTGRVTRRSLAQLKTVDAGDGESIPTLAELFETFGGNLLYNVELKSYSLKNNGLEQAVAELIGRYRLEKRTVVSSFWPGSLRRFRRYSADGLTALVRYKGVLRHTHRLYSGRADHPWHALVNDGYMWWATQKGVRVHAWTVDDPSEAKRLATLGVHGIITNRPGLLQSLL